MSKETPAERNARRSAQDRDQERRRTEALAALRDLPGSEAFINDPIIGEDEHVTATKEDSERPALAVIGDAPVDNINPAHYRSDPSGVECIQVIRHRTYNIGAAMKYLWRAGLKEHPGQALRDKEIEDLKKAIWYIQDEIGRLGGTL